MPKPPIAEAGEFIKTRSPSACEVARSVKLFDAWCSHQECEQAELSDLPPHLKDDVYKVFNFDNTIPLSWIDNVSAVLPNEFYEFVRNAHSSAPDLFSSTSDTHERSLLANILCVFMAWTRLRAMRTSGMKYSEADFAANVYNVFRSPAIRSSLFRTQCPISLPEPIRPPTTATDRRALNAKIAVPDGAIFIHPSAIRPLSSTVKSPWKTLNSHPSVSPSRKNAKKKSPTTISRPSSFRFQSTARLQPPSTRGFEFASAFFEDKKSSHAHLDDALRQNRMSTASSVRQLHSFRIRAPVFGVAWAEGRVSAYVDWWDENKKTGEPRVLSSRWKVREWDLEREADILAVFILIRNIDEWTQGRFKELVVLGVQELFVSVVEKGVKYRPWRRIDDSAAPFLVEHDKENRDPQPKKGAPRKK